MSAVARHRERRARAVAVAVLVVGWTLAAVAYVTAPEAIVDPEVEDLEHSKRYVRELERIGGKAGVLANDLDEWLAALWEGRTRALTLAVVTAGLAGGTYAVVRRDGDVPPDDDERGP